jgi:hypothetical protein
LRGLELRTSQTTTEPSCDATANFVPFEEKAVENEAARVDDVWYSEESTGGMDRVVIGVKVRREPPERRWR